MTITLHELLEALGEHFIVEGLGHIYATMDAQKEVMHVVASTSQGIVNITLRRDS